MILSVLEEDTALPPCEAEHGLSLFVETQERALLFDMGKTDLFARNAQRMGVDLARAAFAVLSHGHYDHGGGLEAFLLRNAQAKVYVSGLAFGEHRALRPSGEAAYIGLEPALDGHPRLIKVSGEQRVGGDGLLFDAVQEGGPLPTSNSRLLARAKDGALRPDPFAHELNLLLWEAGRAVLVTGCAHRGIVNIVRRAQQLAGGSLRAVVGGFHLSDPASGQSEREEVLAAVASCLDRTGAEIFPCHCTGAASIAYLQDALGARVHPLRAGMRVLLP